MTTAVFDTLKASRNLKAVGIDEAHAEAIVQSMAEAFEDTVATKSDVVAIRADMDKLAVSVKADVVAVKAELKQDIAAIRADMDKLEASVKADIASVRADMDKLETSVKTDMDLLKAAMLAAFSNTVNRMLLAQLAVAGLLFAALKLF